VRLRAVQPALYAPPSRDRHGGGVDARKRWRFGHTRVQYSHVQQHLGPDGEKIDAGSIDAQNYMLQINYGVNGPDFVNLSLPYVVKQ